MARWKARVESLLSIIGLLFLSLTVAVLQGKRCQDSLLSGGGRSVRAKISGGRGRPWGIFFGFYKTRHILLSDTANCTVHWMFHTLNQFLKGFHRNSLKMPAFFALHLDSVHYAKISVSKVLMKLLDTEDQSLLTVPGPTMGCHLHSVITNSSSDNSS